MNWNPESLQDDLSWKIGFDGVLDGDRERTSCEDVTSKSIYWVLECHNEWSPKNAWKYEDEEIKVVLWDSKVISGFYVC